MRASIQDNFALSALSPSALAAYARSLGWTKTEAFGEHSDVYAAGNLPEIILPRTQDLGDYAQVVSQLISVFASVSDLDEIALHKHLATVDRDALRLRVNDPQENGSIPVAAGLNLISGAQELILAVACSHYEPRPVYRAGANSAATEYLNEVRLGQTEHGSFVLTMLSPVVPQRLQPTLFEDLEPDDDPIGRRMTKQLQSSLDAVRDAAESVVGGKDDAFVLAVESGVSANLCEAIAKLVEPFTTLEASIAWALTRPVDRVKSSFRFASADAAILKEAARALRGRAPRPDVHLFGFVQRLKRDQDTVEGTVTLKTSLDGKSQSVTAVLDQPTYELAVQAHRDRSAIVMKGDLEAVGLRWQIYNGQISDIIAIVDAVQDQANNELTDSYNTDDTN